MNYEISILKGKRVAGLKTRTVNSDPNMSAKIGGLWQRFFGEGVYQSIPGKLNEKTIGLYTNYENGVAGEYDVFVCSEVSDTAKLPEDLSSHIIPAGKYAKFIVRGDMQKAVAEFWMNLWAMELDRKFTSDFEEYQGGSDMSDMEIHIYIALK